MYIVAPYATYHYTLLFEFSSLCQAFTVRATTLEDWPATSPRDAAAVTPRSYII